MPTNLEDVETGGVEVQFASDTHPGQRFQLRELAVYEADEIDGDVPKFGKWFPVEIDGKDAWLQAVSQLIQELQAVENPLAGEFEVETFEKSGTSDHDPYTVSLSPCFDESQTGLDQS